MMMTSKMVCCLKANGKVLREFKDTVYVPFGSEYSILLKNLNSKRAIVTITIDGTDVVPGGLVVNANQEIDLERFVTDMSKGNKFKFIERTAGIEKHRGVKSEDGLIRVSFKYEKVYEQNPTLFYPSGVRTFGNNDIYSKGIGGSASFRSGGIVGQTLSNNDSGRYLNSAQCSTASYSAPQNDVGITVQGSLSEQKFISVSDFVTESQEHVIVLRILGETDVGIPIAAPVTVKTRQECVTCGKLNKSNAKFCSECGTSLQIV
jgi:hypothetical protein